MNRILSLAASLLLVSGFTTAQATPLTLEDVNATKQVVTVRMNPAGDRIAYLLQVPREIYVDDDGKPHRSSMTLIRRAIFRWSTPRAERYKARWAR